MTDDMIPIAHLSQFEGENPLAITVEGLDLVAVRHNDTVSLFEGRCPHQGTLLSEGSLDNDELVCRAHGWRFNCLSGASPNRPGLALKKLPVKIDAGHVLVDRQDILEWKRPTQQPAGSTPAPRPRRSLDDLPGPKGVPLLGNFLQLDMTRFHKNLEEWAALYGPIYRFKIGRRLLVVVSDPELVGRVLRQRPDTYSRMRTMEPVFSELGVNGVFSAEGFDWRRQRRLVMQALDARHLRQFYPTMRQITGRLQKRWQRAAAVGAPVDVQQELRRYTVDVTTNLAFGYDMNTLEQEGDVIQQHLEKIFPVLSKRVNALFPHWRYVKLPADRALDRALVEVRQRVGQFIAHSRQALARYPERIEQPTNLLESLLVARDEAGALFSEDEIYANAVTMLLAGEDTTANSIAWLMHFLVRRPDVQRKAQAEVDAVLGPAELLSDYGDAGKLTYLEAVTHETMRLKPVAPLNGHQTLVDVDLDGVHIPAGTTIVPLTRPAALQPDTFPEPETFKPERWLGDGNGADVPHPQAFMPFGSGPRLCPGRSLALLEIKTAMAMICRNFDLSPVEEAGQVQERFAFTMLPANLFIRLSPRQAVE